MQVQSIESHQAQVPHVDLTVEKNHNFFANDVLVHNCNLPARNVVIVGTHRGIQEVDSLDIIQEIGRSGRYGLDEKGDAYVIIPTGETNRWRDAIQHPRPVHSVLQKHETLAFHILAEIQNKEITGRHSLLTWFTRSLAYRQQKFPFSESDAQGLLDDLEQMEMISAPGGVLGVTGLGKVSAWLYYSPYDIRAWYENFQQAIPIGLDDELLAWAIGNIPSNDAGFIPKDLKDTAGEWIWRLRNRGVSCGNQITSVMAAHSALSGSETTGVVDILRRNLIYDAERISQAIKLIDSQFAKWGQTNLWEVLDARLKYGVPPEMAELTRLKGIGGARARKLWELGITSPTDVLTPEGWGILSKVFKPDFALSVRVSAQRLRSK